ncbi:MULTISPECIES: PAS domain-containing protein [Methylobacterium]|uniref:histidine kinase n=1 Tax=Methylobacterium aquaticum TaxID=270351 RepID=A0A0C6FWM0_9HYPH|nr:MULTISPECIES: PAS domain-containing protein [Methylobacterium]NGM37105.1 PAS domain-containing protein [Methylobacterium sp. DB0501]BAQ47625.1 histidine kinase [Methylobacterium aquaticum]
MADAFAFLPPGGVTGAEIRARDWSTTSLGPPEAWPTALRSTLSLMLSCPTAMFLAWGPDLLCFYNDAYRPILGYRLPTALGRPFREVWASIWGEIGPLVDATMDGESRKMTDVMLDLSREGEPERSWWSFSYSPVLGDTGAVNGLFCVTAETTDRVLGEAALRESEDHFRHTVELNPQVPWTCDPHGNITSYSNRWLELTGQAAGEPDGAGWAKALHPDDLPGTMTAFAASLSSGEPVDVDYRIRVATTGEYRWMRARARPRRNEGSDIVRWYGVVEDVHDRKAAEERLREMNATLERRVEEALAQRKLWADVFETTDALVAALDPDYRVLALNRAFADGFEATYGARPKVGDDLLGLLDGVPKQRELVRSVWGRALAGEEFVTVEEFGGPGRSRSCYEIRFTTLRDAQGRRIGAFQYAVDATERVRGQEQLARAEEALRHAQKMEAVGQLTGGVAHDFNNLLTIIRSSVEFLRRPTLPEERRARYLEAVADTVDRAAKLTSQLLAFARRQALKPEVFELGERVRATAEMLNAVTGARIRIVTEVPDEPCHVRADTSQFETALVNLAVNARDAMDGEGTLTLGLTCGEGLPSIRGHAGAPGPFAVVRVSDEGAGIAPELLARIFEPFFTTKEVGKGTGLGLSQVIGFAKQSGGDVDVASEVGRGTTFTLYLPHVGPPPESEEDGDDEAGEQDGGRALSVLVVEDNLDVGRFCTQLLEDLGHTTVWAHNAEAALDEMGRMPSRFDAVFSDVVMPGIGGVELARRLRASHPDLPVILTTGYSDVLARDDAHGFELVRKPYSAEQVARALRGVLARQRKRTPA